ncbi:recombination protein NinB [Comamonadaceae bacterium PP-2]
MRQTAVLHNARQGHQVISDIFCGLKPELIDGRKHVVSVRPETRRESQNAHFHSLIGQIAEQDRLHGQQLDAEDWKRLLIDAFKHETKDDPDLRQEWERFGSTRLLPALNHTGFVMVGEQSRQFTVKLAAAFIEWLNAYGAERNIRFKLPKGWEA